MGRDGMLLPPPLLLLLAVAASSSVSSVAEAAAEADASSFTEDPFNTEEKFREKGKIPSTN